uniref:NAD-dependent deacetylase sirtuin-1 n=1 Tax=Anthurium amnicola TaxID=1678845 RepID=A0A1D1Z910_9ARAE
MRCSTRAATLTQPPTDGRATHAPPSRYLLPSRSSAGLCNHAPARAVSRWHGGFLRCRGVGVWTWLDPSGTCSPAQLVTPCRCSKNVEGEVNGVEDVQDVSGDGIGTEGRDGKEVKKGTFSSKELMEQLKRYGVAGVLSYGLLNTFYYLITFLLVWFYFAPAPGKMGYAAAVERFLKLMAAIWAGSQVTKLLRAGGALVLAPLVDKGLSWFTIKFKFVSKGKAFVAIAVACFGLAFLLFLALTLLWA